MLEISGADDNSKTILVNLLMLRCVESVVRLRLSGASGICRKPCRRSSFEKWQAPCWVSLLRDTFIWKSHTMQQRTSSGIRGLETHTGGGGGGIPMVLGHRCLRLCLLLPNAVVPFQLAYGC